MRGIFMGQECGAQTFHAAKTPVAPETGRFRRGNGHDVYGLFLRNIVHRRSLKHSVITVLNKSARVRTGSKSTGRMA